MQFQESELILLRGLLFPETPDEDISHIPDRGVVLFRPSLFDAERTTLSDVLSGKTREVQIRAGGITRTVSLSPLGNGWVMAIL